MVAGISRTAAVERRGSRQQGRTFARVPPDPTRVASKTSNVGMVVVDSSRHQPSSRGGRRSQIGRNSVSQGSPVVRQLVENQTNVSFINSAPTPVLPCLLHTSMSPTIYEPFKSNNVLLFSSLLFSSLAGERAERRRAIAFRIVLSRCSSGSRNQQGVVAVQVRTHSSGE
jgi:hypothetical protein